MNTLAWLYDVYFINEKMGWIAGGSGVLLTTEDGGKTWKKEAGITEDTIRQVYFTDEFTGWLLCERNIYNRGGNAVSYLLKTTNGGVNWERIEFEELGRERIVKIFFNSEKSGFAVGESGIFYALREDRWKRQTSPIRYLILDGTFADAKSGVIVGGNGSIAFTEDGGATWKPSSVFNKPTTKFNSVFFLNQRIGWTVGSGGKIFQSLNGGKTWSEQNSGITNNLNDIAFINSNEGWAIGEEGTILYSSTQGNSWQMQNSRVKHKLEKIFFNGKKGWIVGFGGTVLVYEAAANQNQKPAIINNF